MHSPPCRVPDSLIVLIDRMRPVLHTLDPVGGLPPMRLGRPAALGCALTRSDRSQAAAAFSDRLNGSALTRRPSSAFSDAVHHDLPARVKGHSVGRRLESGSASTDPLVVLRNPGIKPVLLAVDRAVERLRRLEQLEPAVAGQRQGLAPRWPAAPSSVSGLNSRTILRFWSSTFSESIPETSVEIGSERT